MRTTIKLEGVPVQILGRAVELGIARSKTDALRMGIFSLNKEFGLMEDSETEMVVRKMQKLDGETRAGRIKMLSEEDALAPYRKLLKRKK